MFFCAIIIKKGGIRIKVAEILSDTNIGGAGVLLINRLKYSDRECFDTTVILPRSSELKDRFLNMGISVEDVNRCRNRSFEIKAIWEYVKIFKRIDPDIINAHGCLSARIAALITRVPIRIYTRHCVFPLHRIYNYRLVRRVFGLLTSILSHRIIAVAHAAKDQLLKMGASDDMISVIINGASPLERSKEKECIALKNRLGISVDSETKVITICARLEKCKDHACFLDAAAKLIKRGDYFFLILGAGSLENELKDRAKVLGISKRVIFTGFVEDVSPYLSITDVNVNCSIGTETSSLALSEGMSLGIPSVVSDYGGNTYMVRDGYNGYVYKAGDSSELCEAIIRLTENKERYRILAQNSAERFKAELNASCMTKKTQALYNELYKAKKEKDTQ